MGYEEEIISGLLKVKDNVKNEDLKICIDNAISYITYRVTNDQIAVHDYIERAQRVEEFTEYLTQDLDTSIPRGRPKRGRLYE